MRYVQEHDDEYAITRLVDMNFNDNNRLLLSGKNF
jgi:hypothetical protein